MADGPWVRPKKRKDENQNGSKAWSLASLPHSDCVFFISSGTIPLSQGLNSTTVSSCHVSWCAGSAGVSTACTLPSPPPCDWRWHKLVVWYASTESHLNSHLTESGDRPSTARKRRSGHALINGDDTNHHSDPTCKLRSNVRWTSPSHYSRDFVLSDPLASSSASQSAWRGCHGRSSGTTVALSRRVD